jgi:hypothetical protein
VFSHAPCTFRDLLSGATAGSRFARILHCALSFAFDVVIAMLSELPSFVAVGITSMLLLVVHVIACTFIARHDMLPFLSLAEPSLQHCVHVAFAIVPGIIALVLPVSVLSLLPSVCFCWSSLVLLSWL